MGPSFAYLGLLIVDETVVAVGVCLHCGAGLCLNHLGEAARHRVAGMHYGCPHHLERAAPLRREMPSGPVRDGHAPVPTTAAR